MPSGASPRDLQRPAVTPTETCLQCTGDFSQDGPYAVETRVVTIGSSGDFTLSIPTPLEADCPHPMVAWGNGTTVPGGTAYAHFNERMASWGIVAIAAHDEGVSTSSALRAQRGRLGWPAAANAAAANAAADRVAVGAR